MVRRRVPVAVLIAGLVLLPTFVAHAAKGGNGNGNGRLTADPSIALNEPDQHLGGTVTFTVVLPKLAGNTTPRIEVLCYQSGHLVYGEAGGVDQSFLLGGAMSEWLKTGGPADCSANLFYWSYNGGQTYNWLASTGFPAAG